jgi:hypothetical protein
MTHAGAKRAVDWESHCFRGKTFQVRFFFPEHIRRERERRAISERRKVHVQGVPDGYPKGKSFYWELDSVEAVRGGGFLKFE